MNFFKKHSTSQITLVPTTENKNILYVIDGTNRLGTVDLTEKVIRLEDPRRDLEKVSLHLRQWQVSS